TGTRRALPDADEATALFAFRHWRDESGRAMREAHAGRQVPHPPCPALYVASMVDDDVPPALTAALASEHQASLLRAAAVSHVGRGRRWAEARAGGQGARPPGRALSVAAMVRAAVPPALTAALASEHQASLLRASAVSHVGPLLGRGAADCATQVLAWLSAR